jgi:hypothetical protein
MNESLDLWHDLATYLNDKIIENGRIDIDDRYLWKTWLHKLTNEDWIGLLEVIVAASEYITLKEFQEDAIMNAIVTLKKYKDVDPRVLDKKQHKKTAWRTLMVARELWNKINKIDVTPVTNEPVQRLFFHD